MAKKLPKGHDISAHKDEVGKAMHRWKHHDPKPLHSGVGKKGKEGKIVKSHDQAVAIALSMAGGGKSKSKKGSDHAEGLTSLGYTEETSERVYEILGDLFDFTRCQRADGSFYGTKGKCRKGVEAEPRKKRGDFLGGGMEGKVYDTERGKVLKVSSNVTTNVEAQRIASEAGIAPRLIAFGDMRNDERGRKYQIFEKVDTEDISGIGQPGRPSKPLEELTPEEQRREKQAYIAAINLNSLGVAHGDLHGGNVKWDKAQEKPVIMDFDNATVNPKAAKKEAKELLSSIGIRLEEAGLYDEADEMYRLASGSRKNFYEQAIEALEDNFPEG